MAAGGAIIGALRMVLGLDTADLDKGLKNSESSLASFAKKVTTIASGIALEKAIERSVGALVHAIKQGVIEADKLNKMSQSVGIPVEELSRLKHAADLSDVSLETLGKSSGRLAKAMVEVAGGGVGPATQAFNALGISVKNQDGTLKSSSETLADIAEKFAGMRDGAGKTALAIAIFGRAGADMIPLLNMGRDGLKAAGDEAQELGLVLSKETTQAAENFNDNLTRLGKVQDGIILQITARMLPSLEAFSGHMVQAAKDAALMQMVADAITTSLKFITAEIIQTAAYFKRFGEEVVAVWASLKNIDWLNLGASLGKTWEVLNVEGQKTVAVMDDVKKKVADIWADVPTWESQAIGIAAMNRQVALLGAEWTKTAAPIIASGEASKNALQSFLDSQAKRTAAQTAEAATIGLAAGALERLKVAKQADEILDQNKIARTPLIVASITAAGDAAAAAALKLEAARITQMVMSPAEKYAQDLAHLQEVYNSTDMTAATFAERQKQLAEGIGATWEQVGSQMAGGFADLANAFGKSNKEMAMAGQAFGIVQATINTYTAFTKALASAPPPLSYALAAGVLAAGMAKVMAIKSQSFMTGGSMMVRGSGGPDSVPVNMMLSPGEQVDVWRPEQGGGSDPRGGARGGGNTVNLSVPIATTRDALRSIIEGLNDMFADGYKLNVVPA